MDEVLLGWLRAILTVGIDHSIAKNHIAGARLKITSRDDATLDKCWDTGAFKPCTESQITWSPRYSRGVLDHVLQD